MRPVHRAPPPRGTLRAGTERDVYPDGAYTIAASALAVRLGEYCSYCEAPVRGAIQVEHMMAKQARLNTAADQWRNFLLACNQCNSKKGSKPADESGLPNFIWPSITAYKPANAAAGAWCFSFDMFVYERRALALGELPELAALPGPADGGGYVFVKPAPGLPADMEIRANNIIVLTGLNACSPTSLPGDRRFIERTDAWQVARSLAADYFAIMEQVMQPTEAEIEALEAEITATALAFGFWSVWMTVFRATALAAAGADSPARRAKELLTDARLERLFVTPFPGTHYVGPRQRAPDPPAAAVVPKPADLPPAYFGAYSSQDSSTDTPYNRAPTERLP